MPIIKMPDGTTVKFPDDMDMGLIEKELSNRFGVIEKLPEQKGFWGETLDDLAKNWPRYGGATVGAVAGTPGGLPGMVGGAALGAGAGEAGKQIYQQMTGAEDAPQSSIEAAKRIGGVGATEGATELVGGLVMKPLKRMVDPILKRLTPFTKKVTAQGKAALNLINQYMPVGKSGKIIQPGILPAEMTESRALDTLQNIADSSAVGGWSLGKYKDVTRIKALDDMVDDLADSFGSAVDSANVGEALVDIVDGKWENFTKTITTPLYNQVEEMASSSITKVPVYKTIETGIIGPSGKKITKQVIDKYIEQPAGGILVSTKALKEYAQSKVGVVKALGGLDSTSAGDNIITFTLSLPDEVEFSVAKELRTRLRTVADEFSITNKKAPALGLAKQMGRKANNAIEVALANGNPEALLMWRNANALYAQGSDVYRNKFIRRLIKSGDPEMGGSPEFILKSIFRKGGITGIKRVKTAVGPSNWGQFKRWYVTEFIDQTTTKGQMVPNGEAMLQKLFNTSKGMGETTLKEIFSPEELSRVHSVASALQVAQSRQGGTGGMLIQLMQGAAVAGIFTGTLQKSSAFVLLGPEIFARMSLSPTISRVLVHGLTAPRITASTVIRLTRAVERTKREILSERENEVKK